MSGRRSLADRFVEVFHRDPRVGYAGGFHGTYGHDYLQDLNRRLTVLPALQRDP